ncbi:MULTISPECIES: FHA domain-containing protein FhaB/FipA [Corynebacterium]|uniref:FHA domain-containing protein FhaB/FipA n=1 Tax=Corynebacterium TaxID=1716 RepID=UPI00258081E7|nr:MULTISPECIES: FHA domain-containing protein [Corynebacterium]MDN6199059.1 FHA domain-containing protein [Corynebacterium flavescens]MDN6646872.1 FHA domain-containing protein [Corynebacterium flavescens]
MDSAVLLALRIGLLALLWLFILVALNVMRRDTNQAAGASQTMSPGSAFKAPRRREAAKQISIAEGPLKGSHMELGTLEECTMGRAPDCDFVTGDDYSSGHHARLFRRGSEWFVEDLESRNGTFVDGVRIDQPERVGVGSDIKLGRTTVRLMA